MAVLGVFTGRCTPPHTHWQASCWAGRGAASRVHLGAHPEVQARGVTAPSRKDPHGWFLPRVRGGDHSAGFHRRPHRGFQNIVAAKLSREEHLGGSDG